MTRRGSRFLSLSLLLASCATLPDAPDSHAVVGAEAVRPHTASEWRELTSEHFTLTTNFDDGDAKKVLLRLEVLRAALLSSAWGKAKIQGDHTWAVVFQRHGEFAQIADENLGGFATHIDGHTVLVSYGRELASQQIFAHELTHLISGRLLPRQPLWFSEGLACYLETLHLKEDDTIAELGEVDIQRVRELNAHGRMPTAQLLSMNHADYDPESGELGRFYATSWLVVHDLANSHAEAFRRYQIALAKGEPYDAAWRESFPELTPDKLDAELTLYIRYGQYHVREAPLTAPDVHVLSTQELTEPQAHAVIAQLTIYGLQKLSKKDRVARARALLADDLPASLEDPRVLQVPQAWLSPAEMLDAARKCTAAHPTDALAWSLLAEATHKDQSTEAKAERLAAFAKAAELAPSDASAQNSWAWELIVQGRGAEAVEPARKAVAMQPEAHIADTLAMALLASNQCAEALLVQRRAIDLVRPEQSGLARDLAKHLNQIAAQCTPQTAPSQPPTMQP